MKRKMFLLSVLTSLSLLCFTFGIASVVFANSDPELIGVSIDDKYTYNSDFTLPTGTIRLGTASKQSTASIIFPDGSSVKEGRVSLSQEGFYTLVFAAEFDGNSVQVERRFSVEKNLFTVNKPSSSVVYGVYNAQEHDERFGNTGTVSGAYVKLSSGDVLTYNKVIDLSDATKRDVIMNMVITPETIGVYDFNYVEIILTDVYDPENYVTVSATYNESWTTTAVYLLGKANCGQRFAGWEHNTPAIHYGNYGYPIRLRFDGNIKDYSYWFNSLVDNSLAISMDYAERQLHHTARANQDISTLITDLDSSKDHSSLWKGFTTGEVFLSVKCDGYKGSHAGFVITDIMGQPVTTVGEFERTTPYVETDFEGYAESELPYGVVNVPYTLFASEGKSIYFNNVSLTEKVYRDYYGEKVRIGIADGKFTPDTAGTYTIEHTAVDALENVTVSLYSVQVRQEKTAITVSPVGDPVDTGVAGNFIELSEVTSTGGSGKHVIDYRVYIGNKGVEVSDGKFRPTREGTYRVVITATDYLNDTGDYEYDVNVSAGNAPVFIDEIVLPKYFVSGNVYELPKVNAYNFTDGSGSVVSVSVSYLDAETKKNARGTKIVPIALNSGDITSVYYTAELNGIKTEKQVDIPTVIVRDGLGKINIEKLFYTTGGNRAVATDDYLTFVCGQSYSEVSYVNPLVAHDLDVRFSGVAGAVNFDALTIKLTDSLNHNETVTFTYTALGGESKFYVNGNTSALYEVKKSMANESNIFSFSVDEIKRTVKFDRASTVSVPIETYLNGKEYQGFSSGYVYMTFVLEGVNGISELRLRNLNGKVLFADDYDYIGPKIAILGSYGGNVSKGIVYNVPKALACDVIDGVREVKLTINDPKGNFVCSTDGTVLSDVSAKEYAVNLTEYGSYVITLSSVDMDGNQTSFASKVNVVDEEKPIVKINGTMPTTGEVGRKITIPQITATDNYDETTEIYLYMISPTGYMFKLDTRAFIPDRAGIYTIRYYVKDKAGNLVVNSFDISVK